MLKYFTIYSFIFVIILSGCVGKSVDELLEDAEKIMITNLDSANLILENIPHPEKLTDNQRYIYDRISVIYSAYRIRQWNKADSINEAVLDYCARNNDTIKLKEALRLSGWINMSNGNPDKAIEHYSKYRDLSEKQQNNSDIQYGCYNISRAYLEKEDYVNALLYAKNLLNNYEELNVGRKAYYYRHIAAVYKKMNEVDSAMFYNNKVLEIVADNTDYYFMTGHILNEMSEMELNSNHFKESLRYADSSLKRRTNRKDISLFNLTKAKVFLSVNQTDSAKKYLRIAIESSEDGLASIMAYSYLVELYKDMGDYKEGFYSQMNMNDLFEKKAVEANSDLTMQKYQEEKLKNENNELQLAKREQEIFFLSVALISVVIIVALLFYLFTELKRKKIREHIFREESLRAQSLVIENENKLLRQEKELMVLREKSAILRESLFRKMSVATKIPSLKTSDDELHIVSTGRIDLREPDWNELIHTVDDLFGEFASRLEKEYPVLSKEDIGFCCLLKINVSMRDMADIYCISKAGITKKKTRMKKDKFNIHEEGLSLDDFLASY